MTGQITAILGPTNTGKTYLAVEKMLTRKTGMIGFPLRLLARENYDKVVLRRGVESVALITGEEKILPKNPSYFICTVEAMPLERQVDFLAIDEIQMAADVERGHIFTERLLSARGDLETMFLGAETIKPLLKQLVPEIEIETRPRFSKLVYTGVKKITRLPPRSAIVGFSLQDVYALAELIRRQRGGAAVVMGALSPRTRNAQVDMFQSGEVDYLVATDAIGMGLNMDINHVCFTSLRKFDGQHQRTLSPAELAQIAGRAGRYMKDGTFGVAAEATSLPQDVIDRIEEHRFETLVNLFWRNSDLRTNSLESLMFSLNTKPQQSGLILARKADDQQALEAVMRDESILRMTNEPKRVKLLWDVCQIPDFRKVTPEAHARLLSKIYRYILSEGQIPEEWFSQQVKTLDNTNGDIDVVTGRIAGIRIWTYIAQRKDWIAQSAYWQEATRAVEDRLSDALHQKLSQRFVDRRTSVLVKGMKTQVELFTQIGENGVVEVEGQEVGKLEGLRFLPITGTGKFADRVLVQAAEKALHTEFQERIAAITAASDEVFSLENDAQIFWREQSLGKIVKGRDVLHPTVQVSAYETLDSAHVEQVKARLNNWLDVYLANKIAPLFTALRTLDEEQASGAARGILWQVAERLGTLPRDAVADLMKGLNDIDKKVLAKAGMRLGINFLYFPQLLKPAAQRVSAVLWKVQNDKTQYSTGFATEGKMSFAIERGVPRALYLAQGYAYAGNRAIRVDVMERFTAKLREITRQEKDKAVPLPLDLLSIAGLKRDEAEEVFGFLGFKVTKENDVLMIRPQYKKHVKKTEQKKVEVNKDSPFAVLASLKSGKK